MKKPITIFIVISIASGTYWLGYTNGKREGFWTSFAHSIGLAHILRSNDGLSEKGKENLNKVSDMWLYGYFSEGDPPQKEALKEPIESGIIKLIQWKRENGYPIGPQEPLVGIQPVKEGTAVEDLEEEIFTDPMVEHFNAYKERLDAFMKRNEMKIQPGEVVNASAAAGKSENHLND